jgi:hypothetical protein
LDNAVRLEGYVEYIASLSKISKAVISEQLARGGGGITEKNVDKNKKKPLEKKRGAIRAQEKILLILSQNKKMYDKYADFIRNLEFEEGILRDTLNNIIESNDYHGIFSPASYIAQLENTEDRSYLSRVFSEEMKDDERIKGYLDVVMVDNLNRRVEKAKADYAEALEGGDLKAANENLNLVKALTKSIQSVKSGVYNDG